MRFTKGSKVEVFSKKDVPTGAWLCAEIIRGNGHTYSVKYGCSPTAEEVVERVPRKVIRSCPPTVQRMIGWVLGDTVEVFDNLSWKTSRIVKVIGNDNFLVSILGLAKSLLVHKSHLRVRQCWQDGKWSVIEKGTEVHVKRQTNTMMKQDVGGDCFHGYNEIQIQEPQMIPTRTWKRKLLPNLYDAEAHLVNPQKRRLIKNSGIHQQICSVHPSETFEKVDSVVYPNVRLGENNVHSSFNIATAEFSTVDAGCGNDSILVDSTISVHNDGCTSSVGSCSTIGHDADELPLRFSCQHSDRIDDYCSDAESSSGVEYEKEGCSLFSNKQLGVHRSELYSYFSIVKDLYSSGPLNWEDEAKLTSLREMLHISDDEHLKHMELWVTSKLLLHQLMV